MEKVKKTDAEWQAQLTPEQFEICRQKGTERPFTGEYETSKATGTYVCVCCGNPLFNSTTKYESGSGWPSFFKPVSEDVISEKSDNTMLSKRTEILCSKCDSHLGHVFDDGPQPTGLRYCTNSASLKLKPSD